MQMGRDGVPGKGMRGQRHRDPVGKHGGLGSMDLDVVMQRQ